MKIRAEGWVLELESEQKWQREWERMNGEKKIDSKHGFCFKKKIIHIHQLTAFILRLNARTLYPSLLQQRPLHERSASAKRQK